MRPESELGLKQVSQPHPHVAGISGCKMELGNRAGLAAQAGFGVELGFVPRDIEGVFEREQQKGKQTAHMTGSKVDSCAPVDDGCG